MKLPYTIILFATLGLCTAFAPAATTTTTSPSTRCPPLSLSAKPSRRAFLTTTAALLLTTTATTTNPTPAHAGTMQQENVSDPTEVWETGAPSAKARKLRNARYDRFENARTQMDSNFAPIKRLTLERKSPVTRLDINAPDFTAYKKSYPGLYKKAPGV